MKPVTEEPRSRPFRRVRRFVPGIHLPELKAQGLRLLALLVEARRVPHPFFQALHDLLAQEGDVSLEELTDAAGEQTYGLLILVSGLTSFIPGVSMAGGALAMVLGLEMLFGMPHPWLPRRLGRVKLHRGRVKDALARLEGWLLKLGKPGTSRPLNRRWMGAVVAWTGLLLALPVPPLIPFGNTLPAAAICLLGAALLEERPGWAWLGILGMGLTSIYLGISFQVILHYLLKFLH